MAGLKNSGLEAEVVWLGHVSAEAGSLRSVSRDTLDLMFSGVAGEQREGICRASCTRVRDLYPVGTEIANTRQLSLLSDEELVAIAAEMGLSELDPTLVGASLIVRGIPDFTHVPPASRLQFASGATVTTDVENAPCVFPGKEIEAEAPGFGKLFKPAARDRRGVTAWIERPGTVSVGDRITLFVPDQRAWVG